MWTINSNYFNSAWHTVNTQQWLIVMKPEVVTVTQTKLKLMITEQRGKIRRKRDLK